MDYITLDKTEAKKNARLKEALDAEKEAFLVECHVKRADSLADLVDGEAKDAAKKIAKNFKDALKTAKKKAKRNGKDIEIPAQLLLETKVNALAQWINSIESEHVTHTTQKELREEALENEELTDAERAELTQQINENTGAISILEHAWSVATQELQALQPAEPEPEEEEDPEEIPVLEPAVVEA